MPRILVVDDEDDLRESIADLLRSEGFDVATASDGSHALSYLRGAGQTVALILLDLTMPEVDGCTFRRRQLADPALASIPVVILSGEHNVRVVAASLGVADFLIKPIELAMLLNVVQRYCSS